MRARSCPVWWSHSARFLRLLAATIIVACISSPFSDAQSLYSPNGWEPPVMDNQIIWHVLFDQLEGRTNGPDNEFRWAAKGGLAPT